MNEYEVWCEQCLKTGKMNLDESFNYDYFLID